jgi:hypothetical protein
MKDQQDIILPKGSKILSVAVLNDVDLVIYALVDVDTNEKETHTLIIHGTGHCADDVNNPNCRFIGTVDMCNSRLVWHVFELEKGVN